eukprot:s136_g9.t1
MAVKEKAIQSLVPAGATLVVSALLLRRWWRSRKEPPSFQMGLPVVGPIIQFLKDPMELIRLGYQKMGGIFKAAETVRLGEGANFFHLTLTALDFDLTLLAQFFNGDQHRTSSAKAAESSIVYTMATKSNIPWRCARCRQLCKSVASSCPRCQLHWQQCLDQTYVHGGKKNQHAQQTAYAVPWQDPANWTQDTSDRQRSKSRNQTPRGRRQKSASRSKGDGKGPPPMPPQIPPQLGKGANGPPPLPPPVAPWPGFGTMAPQMMMMPQAMQPNMASAPTMAPPSFQVPMQPVGSVVAPAAPTASVPVTAPATSQSTLTAEEREFLELARTRQKELPADLRHKVQNISKREGARATKNFHTAVKEQGHARTALEDALQARSNLITSWRQFIQEAVKTWQDYTALFQNQERELQERIQKAQENFAAAKVHVDESKEAASKVAAIEIASEDEDELPVGQASASTASERISASLQNLTESLQQLQSQAANIEIEEEKTAKRPRTMSPKKSDQDMGNADEVSADAASKQHFA